MSNFLCAQVDLPENRQYEYSKDRVDYYFYLKSDTAQSISFGKIYGYEKCRAHVINNSADSILIHRVGSRNHPLYWFLDGMEPSRLVMPNDTIHLYAKWARRHGPFNRSITLQYRSGSNLNMQYFSVSTKGQFIDSLELSRQEEALERVQEEKAKRKREEHLKIQLEKEQSRQAIYKNGAEDSIPVKIRFYEDGTVRFKEYKRNGIIKEEFDQSGYLKKTWDDEGILTEYYPNGNRKYKSGKERFSTEVPYVSYYFQNGCLQKEVFLNASIIKEYDSLQCNQLLSKTIKDSTINNSRIIYYDNGEITRIKFFPQIGYSQYAEHTGTFQGYQLKDGFVNYYSSRKRLLFSSQIIDGKRDNVLTKNEKQGNQINLIDLEGRKTGLWITQKSNETEAIHIPSNLKESISDFRAVAWKNYIYDKGDTVNMVYLHDYGGIRGYFYLKDKEKRIQQGDEIGIFYHENGFLKSKSYELRNGLSASINYSEEIENQIIGGRKGNWSKLIFKNKQLAEIRSLYKVAQLDVLDVNTSIERPKDLQNGMSVVEKGNFKHFELYNGFIYYYDENENLTLTEKVVNGVIQYNPRINLTEKQLIKVALRNDLNFNGWVEKREIKSLTSIRLRLTEEEIESFNWSELAHFNNLKAVNCNDLMYRLSDYSNQDALKLAVLNKSGAKINYSRQRYPWDEPRVPEYEQEFPELTPVPKVIEFPDVEAKFPGGKEAMEEWIAENIVESRIEEGGKPHKMYVRFTVQKDGSLTDIRILKGVNAEIDKEVKRSIRSMPKWEHALSQGEVCVSKKIIAIVFVLK
ncbi:hypothetical protein CW751_00740 [Brumimicrobium salinarum]|uniref:TonB C-terminal domain-containing protein n=2 Tax=Brumimicrobium salinarum TaxID=2058658 RepID=A0A2I0R5P9_9FLAO|nr:hypothetical protein CW751_00740 [Brumimicrobium salinarum]